MDSEIPAALAISGGGTTMDAILGEAFEGSLKGKLRPLLVIASRVDAGGIKKALDRGIQPRDIIVTNQRDFPDEDAWGEFLVRQCLNRGVEFWGQYGWGVKTPGPLVEVYSLKSVNQHPGGLRYRGLGFGGSGMLGRAVHAAVLHFARTVDREFSFTEAVSHRVTKDYDEGALLNARVVPIRKRDDMETLQQRVLPVEHSVQIETIDMFYRGVVQELDLPPLILPGEESLLTESKRVGTIQWPHG